MNALAALTGALLASSWQVVAPAAAYAALRLVHRGPRLRYLAALVTLGLQVAWPALTFLQLNAVDAVRVSPSAAAHTRWWFLLPWLWALGAATMLVRLLGGLLVVRRWVRAALPLEAALAARFEALRARLGVRAVRFGLAARLDVPLTVGFWRPVVLVPASLLSAIPVESLELLVAHELAHVRRWDALVNAVQMVVEALLFFHPAMWWVSSRAREEREYCCDEEVVGQLGAARPYAEALLALERAREPATGLAVASTGGAFVNRIRRLFAGRSSRSVWSVAAAVVVLIAATTALALSVRASTPAPLPVSAELKPVLQGLCQNIRAQPCRPEIASLKAPPEDMMTIVIGTIGEENPAFARFNTALATVPAAQRREVLTRTVSEAVGEPWRCPEFDTIWEMRPVDWCGAR